MDISIIIVNYNVRDFLEHALVSIEKALQGRLRDGRLITGEIFVVDNASDDGSIELVRKKFPHVQLIVNEENLGFARANNIALAKARGRYILLINPDTVVQEDTLTTMIDFFEERPNVGAAGCKILNPDGSLQLACRRSFPSPWVSFAKTMGLSSLFPKSKLFGRYNLTYLDPDEIHEVDALSGSFMMVRREVYEQVGGLDENFFMYGEDLDWCYRIQKAGWKIFYVPLTQIIHYKGESAKRSDFDDVKTFYQAMHLFVEKHLSGSLLLEALLRVGIVLRRTLAFIGRFRKPLLFAMLDYLLVALCLLLGEYLWLGRVFHFPRYAYPVILAVPPLIFVVLLFSLGVYTTRNLSLTRTTLAVLLSFLVISSLTFFFKDYAFSRAVVVISSGLSLVALLSWRIVGRVLGKGGRLGRGGLLGRRTLIVGVGNSGQEVLRKLRTRLVDGYNIVGFIDVTRQRVGEKIMGVEILGSVANIGKIIEEKKITEVIFSTDALSYRDILSVISRSRDRSVNFRLVPSSIEVIIGKTHIDQLEDIPLLDIDYNIHRLPNRIAKRLFDLVLSSALLLALAPFHLTRTIFKGTQHKEFSQFLRSVVSVFKGKMSLVGPASDAQSGARNGRGYLGKPGLTGIAQLVSQPEMTNDEVEKYDLYYAKNQSLWLDTEILIKFLVQSLKKRKGGKDAQSGS